VIQDISCFVYHTCDIYVVSMVDAFAEYNHLLFLQDFCINYATVRSMEHQAKIRHFDAKTSLHLAVDCDYV
jgi:hypothetical protein